MFAKSTLLRIACTLSVLMGIGKLIQVFLKKENPIGPLLIYRENFDSEFYTELLQNKDFRKPKFRLGNANKNSSLTVAIQHHSANGPKYLYETINVFLTKLSFDDKQTTTFLVFIAGNNKTYAQVVANELKKRFSMEFDLGTIEVLLWVFILRSDGKLWAKLWAILLSILLKKIVSKCRGPLSKKF